MPLRTDGSIIVSSAESPRELRHINDASRAGAASCECEVSDGVGSAGVGEFQVSAALHRGGRCECSRLMGSEQAALGEAHDGVAGDDEVVEDTNVD